MVKPALISVEEYRKMITEPDCEHVDGVIIEGSAPERDHAAWQAALLYSFGDREQEWGIAVHPSLSLQISPTRFRIPDVTVLSRQASREQVVIHPPLAAFEILSPEDSMTGILEKLEAYEQMGIPAIWVINPRKPEYYRYSSGQLTPLPSSNFRAPTSAFR